MLLLTATTASAAPQTLRVATFNASLNRATAGALSRDLTTPDDAQAQRVAAIIQQVRPDVLLLNEFDYDEDGKALRLFLTNYLQRAQYGGRAIEFAYSYTAAVNTGVPSGVDLNNDGRIDDSGQDALGFGQFPGQYGMVLLSKYRIDLSKIRTFRQFLWRDMPGAAMPPDWYSSEALAVLPLSSKSHWDIPVRVGAHTLHVLASHPTPPAFDGPEDRNGARNHDEIRFWVDYLTPANSRYIHDDTLGQGGLRDRDFVLLGDLNSDSIDGDSRHEAIGGLLAHPRVTSRNAPSSAGAVEAAATQGGINAKHQGDPRHDTADFNDRSAGNLRVDYVLPSRTLSVCDSGVFWPSQSDPLHSLLGSSEAPTSDHHLVWADIAIGGQCKRSSAPTGQ